MKLPPFAFIGDAAASAQAAAADLGSGAFWALLLGAQILIILGYLASSLPAWAGWIEGSVLQRLTIVQGAIVAVVAGNAAFFLGLEYGSSQIATLISAMAGGYGGDKLLAPLMTRIFGKTADKSGG